MKKQYRRRCIWGWDIPALQNFSILGFDFYRLIVEAVIFWGADDVAAGIRVIYKARLEHEEDRGENSITKSSNSAQLKQHINATRWNLNFSCNTRGYNKQFSVMKNRNIK